MRDDAALNEATVTTHGRARQRLEWRRAPKSSEAHPGGTVERALSLSRDRERATASEAPEMRSAQRVEATGMRTVPWMVQRMEATM